MRATIALLIWLLPSAAFAQAKIALLIGNQAYDASVGILKNSYNDIAVVGEALRAQNFDVLPPIKDASRSAILGGVRELVRRLNEAGADSIGFVYYSGHGAAEKGTNINYLYHLVSYWTRIFPRHFELVPIAGGEQYSVKIAFARVVDALRPRASGAFEEFFFSRARDVYPWYDFARMNDDEFGASLRVD